LPVERGNAEGASRGRNEHQKKSEKGRGGALACTQKASARKDKVGCGRGSSHKKEGGEKRRWGGGEPTTFIQVRAGQKGGGGVALKAKDNDECCKKG